MNPAAREVEGEAVAARLGIESNPADGDGHRDSVLERNTSHYWSTRCRTGGPVKGQGSNCAKKHLEFRMIVVVSYAAFASRIRVR